MDVSTLMDRLSDLGAEDVVHIDETRRGLTVGSDPVGIHTEEVEAYFGDTPPKQDLRQIAEKTEWALQLDWDVDNNGILFDREVE